MSEFAVGSSVKFTPYDDATRTAGVVEKVGVINARSFYMGKVSRYHIKCSDGHFSARPEDVSAAINSTEGSDGGH